MKSAGKIFLTFLGGAAAGALAGVLFAPESGKKNRESLSRKARDLKKNVQDSIENSVSSFRDVMPY